MTRRANSQRHLRSRGPPVRLCSGDGGHRRRQGPASDGRALTFAEIATENLKADGSYASDKRTYSYGTHAAHVAVDPKTGHVQVLEYASVEDVGRIINPATVHAQTLGAIVQGLGGALLEHLKYDEDGQLLTASYADYLVPAADDFPKITSVTLEMHPSQQSIGR